MSRIRMQFAAAISDLSEQGRLRPEMPPRSWMRKAPFQLASYSQIGVNFCAKIASGTPHRNEQRKGRRLRPKLLHAHSSNTERPKAEMVDQRPNYHLYVERGHDRIRIGFQAGNGDGKVSQIFICTCSNEITFLSTPHIPHLIWSAGHE